MRFRLQGGVSLILQRARVLRQWHDNLRSNLGNDFFHHGECFIKHFCDLHPRVLRCLALREREAEASHHRRLPAAVPNCGHPPADADAADAAADAAAAFSASDADGVATHTNPLRELSAAAADAAASAPRGISLSAAAADSIAADAAADADGVAIHTNPLRKLSSAAADAAASAAFAPRGLSLSAAAADTTAADAAAGATAAFAAAVADGMAIHTNPLRELSAAAEDAATAVAFACTPAAIWATPS